LQQGLIDHFLKYIPVEIYGGARNYNQTDHIVKFTNKSTLRFGHCQHESDVRNYQGGEYLFIGFDELTEFTYPMWSFMTSRNRCPVPGSFPNMAGATNHGGVGHAWVKALWLDKKPVPGQDAATYDPKQYDFIRARVTDNPVYANDPNYMATLNSLPKGLRDAMLDGSWDVFAGQYFDNFDKTENVIPRELVERIIRPWWPRWISHDWGYAHHSPILWHARGDHEGKDVVVTYRELVLNQMGERQLGEEIAYRTRDEKLERYFLSPDAFAKRTSANTIAHELGDAVARHGIPRPDAADNDRVGGWRLMHEKLGNRTWLLSEDCPQLINALPLLVRDEKNLEDVAKTDTLEDDVADCARYGLKSMLSPNQKPRNVVLSELLDPIPDYHQK
jgi:phage terminase large subunit